MPGKLTLGLDALSVGTQSGKSKVAKAYCEGRAASAAGALIGTNPNAIEAPKGEAFIAWDQGWTDEDSGSVDVADTGCAI